MMPLYEFAGTQIEWRAAGDDGPGQFLRAVRYGRTLYERRGDRGATGRLELTKHHSAAGAKDEMDARLKSWHYHTGTHHEFTTGYGTLLATDDPEAKFLEAWADHVRAAISQPGQPRTTWVMVRGLIQQAPVNHGAFQLLAALQSGPHAIDIPSSTIVATSAADVPDGYTATHPDGTLRGVGFDVLLHRLGPRVRSCVHGPRCCEICATRQAELVAYLMRDLELRLVYADDISHIVATANRLVRTQAHPPASASALLLPTGSEG